VLIIRIFRCGYTENFVLRVLNLLIIEPGKGRSTFPMMKKEEQKDMTLAIHNILLKRYLLYNPLKQLSKYI
jgi:hypothetical protein